MLAQRQRTQLPLAPVGLFSSLHLLWLARIPISGVVPVLGLSLYNSYRSAPCCALHLQFYMGIFFRDFLLWKFVRNHLLNSLLEHPPFSGICKEGTSLQKLIMNMIHSTPCLLHLIIYPPQTSSPHARAKVTELISLLLRNSEHQI